MCARAAYSSTLGAVVDALTGECAGAPGGVALILAEDPDGLEPTSVGAGRRTVADHELPGGAKARDGRPLPGDGSARRSAFRTM
jgi:hypothetical protein